MTSVNWSFVELAARLLEHEEREAVLGDLVETHENAWDGLFGVLGLIVRRQAMLWKGWRPWLAGFGVAFPSSFLLMGVSLSVSWSYQRLLCPELLKAASLNLESGFMVFLWQALLLAGWAWTGGFVVGSTSRRTLWASALLCYSPCLFCLSRFRIEVVVSILFVVVLVTGDLGSTSRIASFKNEVWPRVDSGCGSNRVDDSSVGCRTTLVECPPNEFKLGSKPARMVSGSDGT